MAIFILAKCSCSSRQARDALPGWGEGGSWAVWWVIQGRLGQPEAQANISHLPNSVEKGGCNSLDHWLQLLSVADVRAGHSARIHSL